MTSLGVQVHRTAVVAPNVDLGPGSVVGEYVVLGKPPGNHFAAHPRRSTCATWLQAASMGSGSST